jgi:hypothetical protein
MKSAFGVVHISKGMPMNPKNTIPTAVMNAHKKRIALKLLKGKIK